MNPGASIIIVTYNSETSIVACLTSVLNTLRPIDEVIIIDNFSADKTVDIVREFILKKGSIRFFPQMKNTGFSRGCNVGIENSDKEFIILLNPDTEVFGEWTRKLTAHFSLYEKTGAVGALSNHTLNSQNIISYFEEYNDYLMNASGLIKELGRRFYKRSIPTKLLMGFCLALKREIIDQLGALDEDIFLGDDDLELSWRLRENGYWLRVALDVFVNHENHVSFDTLPENEADRFVQQGTDVLFRKMQAYYRPKKVPHPKIYFCIDWWRPSILQEKSEEEIFNVDVLPCRYQEVIPRVKEFIAKKALDEAVALLNAALKIRVNDYVLWMTLGSIYLQKKDWFDAEVALKNAWSLEREPGRATTKLAEVYRMQNKPEQEYAFLKI